MGATDKLKDLALSESGFVFDPYTGSTFSANDTGRKILDGLRRGLDRDAIAAELRQGWDGVPDDLGRDIDDFVLLLRRQHLLPPDFSL
ncbi:MAG: PqqD family protein [Deltaproteobacteria bacterium]|nr:PqqD family protein [Deltaproteobacteria bacterium]